MRQLLQPELTRAASRPPPSRIRPRPVLQAAREDAGHACACGGGCPRCAEQERDALNVRSAPPEVHGVLASPGRPLEQAERAPHEGQLRHDFSSVRIHEGEEAAEAAASVGARAFTVGEHIVFGDGEHAPGTPRGEGLLAHELTHVAQQRSGMAPAPAALHRMPDRITAMTLDLGTSTITISLDDGRPITGRVGETNLIEGFYTARWDSAGGELAIEPWPTRDQVVSFEVSGTPEFLRRYARLRTEITSPIPFAVVATSQEQQAQPQEQAPPPSTDERIPNAIYLTPEEASERCRTGDLPNIMTFPLRMPRGLWRFSVAPIHAERDGDDIVVTQPVNAVFADEMFRREVRTLPLSTFLGGVRLKPNELVRVRLYDDDERLVCVTGEGMLRLSEATDTATLISILGTIVEAGSLFIPAGVIARPVLGAARTLTAAAMIGTAEAVPIVGGRAAASVVVETVEQRAVAGVVSEATTRAVSSATQQAAADVTVEAATQGTTRVGSGIATRATAQAVAGGSVVAGTQAGVGAATDAVTQAAARQPIAGATEVTVSQAGYHAALSQVFPSQFLNQVTRAVDSIGQSAAQRAAANPQFVAAVQAGNWRLAGTLFHSAAATEARALPATAIPQGWTLEAERTIQAGLGGGRADLLLRGPAGEVVEFDWKTSGFSALSSGARREMARHAGQISANVGGTLATQESRSWIDFVRALLPGVAWP